jgi:hypothetical protein
MEGDIHTTIVQLQALSIGLACFTILTTLLGFALWSRYMNKALRELGETLRRN